MAGVIFAVMAMAGCATPAPKDVGGRWRPVNRFAEVPQAIPLQQAYIYQASPADSTLKTMLGRWARDARLTLSYLHPNDYTRNHEHLTRAKTEEVKDFREVDLPIIKLLFEEEKPLLEQVRDFIVSQEWGKRYELIFSSDHLLELTRRGATKGGMILKLAKLLGVARKDIYCIGDHNNDIPMLEVSEIGFAPENAIPEVKEWGAHIVCHCKDGALADVVEILDKRY